MPEGCLKPCMGKVCASLFNKILCLAFIMVIAFAFSIYFSLLPQSTMNTWNTFRGTVENATHTVSEWTSSPNSSPVPSPEAPH